MQINSQAMLVLVVTLFNFGVAAAATDAEDPIALFQHGKLDQALDAGQRATAAHPKDWLPHSTLSFLQWQSGDVADAILEGQRAIVSAPANALPLLNLGHIYQSLGQYDDAIPLYEKARKLDPKNWVPWVSLARSRFGKGELSAGVGLLREMEATSSDDFAWHYQLGLSYLIIDQPEAAIGPLQKALAVAPTPEQKSAATEQLMVALLRDGKLDAAKHLLPEFFATRSGNGEAYVRIAAAFPSSDVVDAAFSNLHGKDDSESFFRMGRVFVGNGSLAVAEKCFAHAVEMNPGLAKSHLALAATLQGLGKPSGAIDTELEQASMFDASDPVAKVLQKYAGQMNLVGVDFVATGLTCGCQSTRIDSALRSLPGVALVGFQHKVPYEGTMFIDPLVTSAEKVFAEVTAKTFQTESVPVSFKLTTKTQSPLKSLTAAVLLAQKAQFGDPLEYHHMFDPIAPSLPQASMVSTKDSGRL
jgi:tetratricopeptide (TPR) repeat protein